MEDHAAVDDFVSGYISPDATEKRYLGIGVEATTGDQLQRCLAYIAQIAASDERA